MRMVIKHQLNLRPLMDMPKELKPLAREMVREVGQRILHDAQEWAPKDTGALGAGLYLVTKYENGGPTAMAAATSLNPEGQTLDILSPPSSDYMAAIGSAMAYWEYVEYGTGHGPAQPFLEPAFQGNAEAIHGLLDNLVDMAASKAGWGKS